MDNVEFIDQYKCWEPVIKKIISTKIGKYYYSSILGGDFALDDILYEDHGYLEMRGNAAVGLLFKANDNFVEAKILKKLQDIDKRFGAPAGYRVLEILANNVSYHHSQQHSKQYYWKKISDAKRSIKALNKAKEKLLKVFEKEMSPEDLQELHKLIDGFMGKSNAVFTLWKTYGSFKAGQLPGVSEGSFVLAPRKLMVEPDEYDPEIRVFKQPSKEMPYVNKLTQEIFALLKDKYSKLEIAKIIEFFLLKLEKEIKVPADSIRKKLL